MHPTNLITLAFALPLTLATTPGPPETLHDTSDAIEGHAVDWCYKPCWSYYMTCTLFRIKPTKAQLLVAILGLLQWLRSQSSTYRIELTNRLTHCRIEEKIAEV